MVLRARSNSPFRRRSTDNVTVRATKSAENLASGISRGQLDERYSTVNGSTRPAEVLRCCDIRWFYRVKNDSGKWTPFAGADSLKLEVRWRQKNDVTIDDYSLRELTEAKREIVRSATVAVLDGLYGVAEDFHTCHTIYWNGTKLDLRRGRWFEVISMQPLDDDIAEAIESHHVNFFHASTNAQPSHTAVQRETSAVPDDAKRADEVITSLKIAAHIEVKWKSSESVTLFTISRLPYLRRKGIQIRRGYGVKCHWSDGELLLKHLIFVVHGIGQKRSSTLPQHSSAFRANVNAYFAKKYVGERGRAVFIPVDWRGSLQLDNGLTDAASLPKISNLRDFLNLTFMDLMYYQSPCYRSELLTGLITSLNKAYATFLECYPDFTGRTSLLAHSLGSVMCYDILCGYSPITVYHRLNSAILDKKLRETENGDETLEAFRAERERYFNRYGHLEEFLHLPSEGLNFEVWNLFCVGSPLAVFLIMRGAETVVPSTLKVARIYNIFHPYDPVAYRLEPIVHPQYQAIRPIKLRSAADDRALQSYENIHPRIFGAFVKKLQRRRAAKEKGLPAKESVTATDSKTAVLNIDARSPTTLTELSMASVENTTPIKVLDAIPEEKRLAYRLDFQVQPQMTELSFVSMFSSHSSYWYNMDVAAFVLNQLYQKPLTRTPASETPVQPKPTSEQPNLTTEQPSPTSGQQDIDSS